MGYADRSQFATPFVQVLWSRNGANLQSEAICLAKTELQINLEDFDFADGNHFYQEVYIKKGSCIMEISWYTPDLFGGRQLVTDYLRDFCDRYCAD